MKIESKLFSELRGKLAETAAQMRKGKIVLSKLGIPYHVSGAERSPSQKAIWQRYGKIVENWDKLSPTEKAVYTAQGALIQISGWNAYVQKNMIWDGLDGWLEKKVATISGSTAGEQTNFQMRVKAWKGTGTSSGENVYLDADVRDDFGDVRFTKDDGQTLYNYWLQEKVNGSYAIFWVEIPSIPASPGTIKFWLQHGNPTATTTSSAANTLSYDITNFVLNQGAWVSADSEYSGYPASRIVDDLGVSYYWISAETNADHWAVITFPSAQKLGKMHMWLGDGFCTTTRIQIQYWKDGAWVTAYDLASPVLTGFVEHIMWYTTEKIRIFRAAGWSTGARPYLLQITEIYAYKQKHYAVSPVPYISSWV